MGFADQVGEHAAGALAAQKAIYELRTVPEVDGTLIDPLLDSDGRWRNSSAWLQGWCREIEKGLAR